MRGLFGRIVLGVGGKVMLHLLGLDDGGGAAGGGDVGPGFATGVVGLGRERRGDEGGGGEVAQGGRLLPRKVPCSRGRSRGAREGREEAGQWRVRLGEDGPEVFLPGPAALRLRPARNEVEVRTARVG